MSKFLTSILSTFQTQEGKFSSRKITAFWFVILATLIVICELVIIWLAVFRQISLTGNTIDLLGVGVDMLWIVCAMILLLFGIVTIQQIQNLRFGQKNKEAEKSE